MICIYSDTELWDCIYSEMNYDTFWQVVWLLRDLEGKLAFCFEMQSRSRKPIKLSCYWIFVFFQSSLNNFLNEYFSEPEIVMALANLLYLDKNRSVLWNGQRYKDTHLFKFDKAKNNNTYLIVVLMEFKYVAVSVWTKHLHTLDTCLCIEFLLHLRLQLKFV